MLRIELDEPESQSRCDCCGGVTTTLTRFVYQDEDAYAIYYARFSNNHPDEMMSLAVGLGDWDEASINQRTAFALQLRLIDDKFQVMVVDRELSPWNTTTVLGPMLDREDALKHSRIKEVFHITDHMVLDDPAIRAYFQQRLSHDV